MTTERPLRVLQWTTGNIGERSLRYRYQRTASAIPTLYAPPPPNHA